MDREIKARWLKALRSGRYKQGSCQLRRGDRFCCLGVLADVIDPSLWRDDAYVVKATTGLTEFIEATRMIPSPTRALVGLDVHDCCDLSELNDNGESFEYIADYIEETL